jgi:hypothetical protein
MPEFVTESCLLAAERLAPLAALHSLRLPKYLFRCCSLLVHLHVISELYSYKEQRYLSAPYQKESVLTKKKYTEASLCRAPPICLDRMWHNPVFKQHFYEDS